MKIIFFCLVFLFGSRLNAQKRLDISYTRFGNLKIYSVHNYDKLSFKLKGDAFYKTQKVVYMNDSLLIFAEGNSIRLDQIKKLRLEKHIHLFETCQGAFVLLGAGFFGLNTINNLINDEKPVLTNLAAVIAVSCFGVSRIFRELQIKRISITGNKTLKVIDMNYQDLNSKNL